MPVAEVAEVAAIGKTRPRTKPGRDNSVSLYRNNLLTDTFLRRKYPDDGAPSAAIILNYFKRLNPIIEDLVPPESLAVAHRPLPSPGILGSFLAEVDVPPVCNAFNAANG